MAAGVGDNTKPAERRAVVILSGGLDSTVALAQVLAQGIAVAQLVFFDYGQRALQPEQQAVQAIAQHYGLSLKIISLAWLSDCLPAALTPPEKLSEPEPGVTPETLFETRRVWVPNRNGVFLNIAAALAEAAQARLVVFGANADEAVGFPDNTQAYRDALNAALAYSTLASVRVETPVGTLSKAEIIRLGLTLGVPFQHVWSCYESLKDAAGFAHCGVCPSCRLLRQALDDAGADLSWRFLTGEHA